MCQGEVTVRQSESHRLLRYDSSPGRVGSSRTVGGKAWPDLNVDNVGRSRGSAFGISRSGRPIGNSVVDCQALIIIVLSMIDLAGPKTEWTRSALGMAINSRPAHAKYLID